MHSRQTRTAAVRFLAYVIFLAICRGACASTLLTPGFGHYIDGFQFSVDGQHVLFTAESRELGAHSFNLFITPTNGGQISQVTPSPSDPFQDVAPFLLTPDGQSAVYRQSDHSAEGDLFSIPIAGGPATRLTYLNDATGISFDSRFWLTPLGDRVIYVRQQTHLRRTFDLMSVPVHGQSPPVQLNGDLAGYVGTVSEVSILPNGQFVLYTADQDLDTRRDLFLAPVAGGYSKRINDVVSFIGVDNYALTNSGERVVYRAHGNGPTNRLRLFASPVFDGPETALTNDLPDSVNVKHFELSADEGHVLFTTTEGPSERQDLFSVPLGGGAMIKLSSGVVSGFGVDERSITPFSHHGNSMVAFRTDDSDGYSSFYIGSTVDPNPHLLGRLPTQRGTYPPFSLKASPHADYLLVQSNFSADPTAYLFPIDGDPLVSLGRISQPQFHPDGVHMFYAARGLSGFSQIIWQRIGDVDSATRLTDDQYPYDIGFMMLSPDGRRVLYNRGRYASSGDNLYVASLPVPEPLSLLHLAIAVPCILCVARSRTTS